MAVPAMQGSSILYDFRPVQVSLCGGLEISRNRPKVALGARFGRAASFQAAEAIRPNRVNSPVGSARSLPPLTRDSRWTFLIVAIRNLYWTDSICTFIVGGLILAGTLCEVSGAAPADVAPRAMPVPLKIALDSQTGAFKDDKASREAFSAPVIVGGQRRSRSDGGNVGRIVRFKFR
jgi:hypothetical protein